jgi:hypothetical protein
MMAGVREQVSQIDQKSPLTDLRTASMVRNTVTGATTKNTQYGVFRDSRAISAEVA